ncbi:MAG: AbrB/MazE/SpoVT family DNA-binding domain-containing protein [Longimicrobiales bacterium]|nr:AbrB/MazE/SpoVT family DNA-binding domain-containing protein [Longimicrobiales bacterium]
MLMKVHRKGQVVIPVDVRRRLGIDVGDVLEVDIMDGEGKIELRRPTQCRARALAGSLKEFARGKSFPSEDRISDALRRGLGEDG